MASVVFYFQVHQPFRLRRYSVFDEDPFYFDDQHNAEICRKVADKCYRPATAKILDLVRRHEGRFRVSYALTGVVLDQLEQWAPDVIDLFKQLAETGCCEFLGETYYHSLSFLYSREEFRQQVDLHSKRIEELFGVTPTVFRNTELIYTNDLAHFIASMKNEKGEPRFKGVLCEGVDNVLGFRSPNYLYTPPGVQWRNESSPFRVMLKNYRLSDDIAFRFSNRAWAEWPLSAEKFAGWVDQINGDGYVCNLFMDYETFGEHQWADTGIFEFLDAMPGKVFDVNPGHNHFNTPCEAIDQFDAVGEYDVPHVISWADTERDLSAWLGNAMQSNSLHELYKLERPIKELVNASEADEAVLHHAQQLLNDWRKLTTSDHFYYMCTKYFADGDVHKYFNPYDSPYDAYINFMNVLDNVRTRWKAWRPVAPKSALRTDEEKSMTTAAPALTFTAYLDRMFEYDRWANARVLEAMSSLGDALPQKPVDRLSHLLICQRMWIRRMRDDADQITDFFPSWPLAKTKAEAQAIGAEMREFIQSHSDAELLEDFVYQSSEGAAFRNRRLDIFTQLSQHGCYHRGQIACDLNAMLNEPLVTDYVYFCRQ